MFQRIKTFFQEAHIKADFPRYEASKLQAHLTAAELRFNTAPLEKEVAAIVDKCCMAANEKFGSESSALLQEIFTLDTQIQSKNRPLAILERDYKSEINKLHDQKKTLLDDKEALSNKMKALQAERSVAQESLQEAYERLESAKDRIDNWYKKSDRTPWLLGNGGKKLPKHSPFGQSFGDLEGYKRDRDAAVTDIRDCKSKILNIKDKQSNNKQRRDENKEALNRVFEQINATKAARQEMFDLKQQGVKYSVLKQELSELSSYLSSRRSLLNQLQYERNTFIEQMEGQMGIVERKAAIAEINALKSLFINNFYSLDNQEARLAAHREQWITEHSVKSNH